MRLEIWVGARCGRTQVPDGGMCCKSRGAAWNHGPEGAAQSKHPPRSAGCGDAAHLAVLAKNARSCNKALKSCSNKTCLTWFKRGFTNVFNPKEPFIQYCEPRFGERSSRRWAAAKRLEARQGGVSFMCPEISSNYLNNEGSN